MKDHDLDALNRRRQATARYCLAFAGGAPLLFDADFQDAVATLRENIRAEEGGGGYCHVVTEILEADHGWERLPVSYLSLAGEVICAAHYINVLPDGSLLDPTRDQFGEGDDVSLIRHDSPDMARYRPEFDQDWHPGHPHDDQRLLEGWAEDWKGISDCDAQDALRRERGDGWWLTDKTTLIAYLQQQWSYGDDGMFAARLRSLGADTCPPDDGNHDTPPDVSLDENEMRLLATLLSAYGGTSEEDADFLPVMLVPALRSAAGVSAYAATHDDEVLANFSSTTVESMREKGIVTHMPGSDASLILTQRGRALAMNGVVDTGSDTSPVWFILNDNPAPSTPSP